MEAAEQAGAKAYLIEEPMAAAIGSELPVAEPRGSMIVDIGGGTTEVAIISLGGIVTSRSIRIGGDELDEAIVQYVKRQYNLLIGERTAEEVKLTVGSAFPVNDDLSMEIKAGTCNRAAQNRQGFIRRNQEAIAEPVNSIMEAIKFTLEKTPQSWPRT